MKEFSIFDYQQWIPNEAWVFVFDKIGIYQGLTDKLCN